MVCSSFTFSCKDIFGQTIGGFIHSIAIYVHEMLSLLLLGSEESSVPQLCAQLHLLLACRIELLTEPTPLTTINFGRLNLALQCSSSSNSGNYGIQCAGMSKGMAVPISCPLSLLSPS